MNEYKKKRLAAFLAATALASCGAVSAASDGSDVATENATYVDITINNVKEDTGLELGTGARARGNGSIATGTNSLAIGKNAVATGGNENKDTITNKLNENKQRLQEIQTAQENTDRLLKEVQDIRKQQADVIEAGERVKQVRKSKATAKTAWDTAVKAYTDAVASSDAEMKAAQAKIDDFNSRLTAVSRIQKVDISSDEGVTRAATQFKSMVEDGTSMNMDISFYKDYITSYYKAAGDLRQAYITDSTTFRDAYGGFNNYNIKYYINNIYESAGIDYLITYANASTNMNKNVSLYNDSESYWRLGETSTYLDDFNNIRYDDRYRRSDISDVTSSTTLHGLPKINKKTDIASKDGYDKTLAYWQKIWDAVPDAVARYKNPLITESDKENMKKWTYQNLLKYKANLDTVYYQWEYEQTHDLTWLDKKKAVTGQLDKALIQYTPTEIYRDMADRYSSQLTAVYKQWKKENITDVEDKNKITVSKLTSELAAALNVNKDAVQQIQNKLNTLKQKADQAKQTYENINPSAADLALAANYDKVMRDLLNKSNSLKAEQERLDALRKALTFNDLTNVGENAMAIGTDALSTGSNSMAIGTNTISTGENSIAIGKGSAVTGTNSIAVGTGHIVIGNNAGTFGDPSTIYGDGSYAIGNNNTIGSATTPHTVGTNTFVLGNDVTTTANNAVILGYGSTGRDNTVSVGKAGAERKIIHVADATLSSSSTDAVTGRQLWTTNENISGFSKQITKNAESLKGLSTSVSNSLESIAAMSDGLSTMDTTKADASLTNLSEAGRIVIGDVAKEAVQNYMKSLKNETATTSSVAAKPVSRMARMNLAVSKLAMAPDTLTTSLVTVAAPSTVTPTPTTEGITSSSLSAVHYDTNAPSVTLQRTTEKPYVILKVMDGPNRFITQRVYLDEEGHFIQNPVISQAPAGYVKDTDFRTTFRDLDPNATYTPGQEIITKAYFVKSTEWLPGLPGEGEEPPEYTPDTSDKITGFELYDDPGKTEDISHPVLTVTDTTPVTIKNLADGAIKEGSKEAINGGQLYTELQKKADASTVATLETAMETKANTDLDNLTDTGKTVITNLAKGSVKVVAGSNTTVTTGTDGDAITYAVNVSDTDIKKAVQADLDAKANRNADNLSKTDIASWQQALGTGTVSDGNTGLVTGGTVYNVVKGIQLSAEKLVTTDGTTTYIDKDGTSTTINVGHYTTTGDMEGRVIEGVLTDTSSATSAVNVGTMANALEVLNSNVSGQINALDHKLTKDVKHAGATAAALAALNPLPYDPSNKLNFAVGQGQYRGESATALGVFYQPNEDVSLSLGGTISSGDKAMNAGISFRVGPGNSEKKIVKKSEFDSLKEENKAMKAQLDELRQEIQNMKALTSTHSDTPNDEVIPNH